MKVSHQSNHKHAEPAIPIRSGEQSFFAGTLRWSLEDWMCASSAFSLYTGIIQMMITSPSDSNFVPLLFFSSCVSFMITVSGADWAQSTNVPAIKETGRRFRKRCVLMVVGPIIDCMVFGILLAFYFTALYFFALLGSLLGEAGAWLLVLIAFLPGLYWVGKIGLLIRQDFLVDYRPV
jgi:hypothetical protein